MVRCGGVVFSNKAARILCASSFGMNNGTSGGRIADSQALRFWPGVQAIVLLYLRCWLSGSNSVGRMPASGVSLVESGTSVPYCPIYCPTFDSHFGSMVFGLCHGTRQHRKASQSRWQMDFAIDTQEEIWKLRLGCVASRRLLRGVARRRTASASRQHRRASNGGAAAKAP